MTELEAAVAGAFGAEARVLSVTPSIYATSHPIADVTVELSGGATVTLVRKAIGRFLPGAAAAKPSFLRDPSREVLVYHELLREVDVGAPTLIGHGEGWLLLEKVSGVELYQVGDLEVWRGVAAHLAIAHASLAAHLAQLPVAGTTWRSHVLRYDADFILTWAARAEAALAGTSSARWATAICERYGEVCDRMLVLPQTVIHGELYASNVLVTESSAPVRRVCPIDWEMAAIGPGLLDLAALVAGRWSDEERQAIAAPYLSAVPTATAEDLAVCRLHIAVQWLGWADGWQPPAGNAHPWLEEARALSAQLGLV